MFMWQDYTFIPAMEADPGDQARPGLLTGTVRSGEHLFEIIQGGLSGLAEDAVRAPGPVEISGAGIFIFLLRIAGFFLAELDLDEVIGGSFQVFLAHFRRNFVVGLRQDIAGVNALGIVEDAVKGLDISHDWGE